MNCFHFLIDVKNWNVFRYDTSIIGFLIPVHLQILFLFWFFSSANMNIMLTTVVKTHRLSRVYNNVCVKLKTIRLKEKNSIVPQIFTQKFVIMHDLVL